jgi:Uncharacterized protein conserved in bacteria
MTQAHVFPLLAAAFASGYLILKRKRPGEIIEQVLKTVIGCSLILIGADISLGALSGLSELLSSSFGVHGGVLNTEVFGAILLRDYGAAGFAAFLLAFLVNMLLARSTRRGALFLTGHHLFFLSLMTVSILWGGTMLGAWSILLGGVITGIYAFIMVYVSTTCMGELNKNAGTGLANSAIVAALIGTAIGKLAARLGGKAPEREENGKTGSGANSVQFTTLGVGAVFAVYLLLHLAAGKPFNTETLLSCGEFALVYGVATTMLLLGIRMFLTVFIQLLWDAGQRFVPDLVMGLDASAIIPYSPRAWQSGFLIASLTGTLAAVLLLALRAPFIPLPGLTSFYFAGGVAGVFGEIHGGKRGARLAGGIVGVVIVLFAALFMAQNGAYLDCGAVLGETDYGIWGSLLTFMTRL